MLIITNNKLTSIAPGGELNIIDPGTSLYIFVDKHLAPLCECVLRVPLTLSSSTS